MQTMDGSGMAGRGDRYFGDGKGPVLREEARAAENVYIQKMERERMENLRRKAEKERSEPEKTHYENCKQQVFHTNFMKMQKYIEIHEG